MRADSQKTEVHGAKGKYQEASVTVENPDVVGDIVLTTHWDDQDLSVYLSAAEAVQIAATLLEAAWEAM